MLTPRQVEVAGMVAKGMTAREISREIGATVGTVEQHIKQAAHRIPGETPARHKLALWFFQLQSGDPA